MLDCRGRHFPAEFSEDGERTEVCFLAEPEEIYYFVLAEERIPERGAGAGALMPEDGAGAGTVMPEGRAERGTDSAVFGKEHVLTSAQWGKLPMVQELKEFRFLPCPEGPEGRSDRTEREDGFVCINVSAGTDKSAYVDMPLPVCRTLELLYESKDGEQLATVWEHWMEPGFDDGDWEVLSLKHGPKLYDHVGSRLFRFVLPVGTAAVRRPIPVNGEYALYLNGRLVEAVTGHMPEPASEEERWIPVEGCEEGPGILAIECSSMAPQYGVRSPVTVRVRACRTGLKDWGEMGLGWYAGYGRYETEFQYRALKEGETLWLDLGQVKECAAVFLNGQKIGQKLWKPYRFDISRALREGKNILSIYSCNLIANEFAWDPLGTRGSASSLPSGIFGSVGLYLEG